MSDATDRAKAKKKAQRRAAFLRQTLRWHWISAAICLVGMLLFAVTGITLNHAGEIEGSPRTVEREGVLPPTPLTTLQASEAHGGPLPDEVRDWLDDAMKIDAPRDAAIEWSQGEAYVALPRPGGDGWVSIDTASGEVLHESTDRGWIAYLNDLHKGRNAGVAWKWFIDIFAVGSIVFCVTGLILLQLHSKARPSTWPFVGLGLLIPFLLAVLFIH